MKNQYFFLELTKKYKKGFGDQTPTVICIRCFLDCLLYYPLVLEAQTLVGSPQT